MKIAVAQLDPVVGAFESNIKKISEAYRKACSHDARILLTPELGICGYPPHDLIERPEMVERNSRALEELRLLTRNNKCALVVGHVGKNQASHGRVVQNAVSVLEGGKEILRQAKTLLPTYDVFDEARYFEPAAEVQLWDCDGHKIAIAVCEDLWARDPVFGRRLYGVDPVDQFRKKKAEIVFSLSASPYEWGKRERREKLHMSVAKELGVPLVYVNQVGATDEILFDGGSFAIEVAGSNKNVRFLGRLSAFKPAFGLIELSEKSSWLLPDASGREDGDIAEMDILSRGLKTGIREYFQRTGFKKAVIGLSGGIDSAVVGTLAAKALGSGNVIGVAMPSQYSSTHSLEDAELLARNLGINFEVRPIKFIYSLFQRELSQIKLGQIAPVALENLQSRIRGTMLMTLANHHSALVLTTGNKSELATGYCTLYGDMIGALAPIGDLFKTRVYELARFINQSWGAPIPERSITRAPTAELKPGQLDSDSLPEYESLDAVLEGYIEKMMPVEELEAKFNKKLGGRVREILRRLELNEYKRRQAVPVLKVSPKAFGIGRRIPLAKEWDQ